MAKKITDFDNLTTSASTDLFEVVDVSDTTEAVTGTNKKITRDNLFGQDLTTTGTPTFAGLDVNSGAVNLVANFESTDVTADIYLKDSSATSIIRSTGGSLRFSSDTSANMFNIDSSGNVGIGTTLPGAKLEVEQSAAATGLFIDQNGNGIALNIDTESTTEYGLNIDAASYRAARIAQAGNDIGLYVQKTGTGVGDVLQIVNNGTGDSIDIVHLGSGKAISVDYQDTGANNNVIYASSPTGSSNDFGARWLDSISRFGVLLGNGTTAYRLWVDDNGDLRIHNADPTAHNNGTVVGTQT